jgi:predicted AlkP superfamily phosphohydrolase/phosphomutase
VSSPALSVIGLDAATFSVIDPMVRNGDLPHLRRLMETGVSATLRSTTHPLTPQAWNTLVTGVNAAQHGIFDFTERDATGYGLRIVNGGFRRAPALWDRLAAAGRRCGLVNVPFTWPAPAIEGFAIAGFDAADIEAGMTHPPQLLGEIRRRFGPAQLDHRFPLDGSGRIDLARVRREAEQKVEITLWLLEEFEPELLFMVFMALDHVQHLCWDDWEERGPESSVGAAYRILDECVGAILKAVEGGDVVAVSDHGAGPLDGVVNLNAWLAQQGYLAYVGRATEWRRTLVGRAPALRRLVPERARRAAKQRLAGVRERTIRAEDYSVVDWGRTRAFSYGTFGNVVLNVRGREAQGTVEPGESYERTREELRAGLLDLRGRDGDRIVAAVHRREDLFFGPELGRVPDLLVEFRDYAWLGKGVLKERASSLWDRIEIEGSRHSYVGSHRHEGILVVSGPSVRRESVRTTAGIHDVAPTLFYLLSEPVPADLEGRVLTECVATELLDARPPTYDDDADDTIRASALDPDADMEEVERRLRGLGYLE